MMGSSHCYGDGNRHFSQNIIIIAWIRLDQCLLLCFNMVGFMLVNSTKENGVTGQGNWFQGVFYISCVLSFYCQGWTVSRWHDERHLNPQFPLYDIVFFVLTCIHGWREKEVLLPLEDVEHRTAASMAFFVDINRNGAWESI